MFKFNPKKCNSTSSFSCCAHRDKSNCLITLPIDVERVKLFERPLIGGFSCVNTQLAKILLPKIDRNKYKLIHDVKINNIKQKNE